MPTLRDDPADAEAISHRLKVPAHLYSQLGTANTTWKTAEYTRNKKVKSIITEKMESID
jgi:prolyl-tRNA synthetase